MHRAVCCLVVALMLSAMAVADEPVRIAVFDVDATPPLGAPMAYDPVKRLDELTLRCRGIVILSSQQPIVLCAVDWIGIANEGHEAFCSQLAEAAGTAPERVAVHALHQHDAPGCDFTAERLMKELQVEGYGRFESTFHRQVIQRAADAIRAGIADAQPVTHWGWGQAAVKDVASNRRILGPDGKVKAVRYSSTKDEAIRAEPDGVIDPLVMSLSFWNDETPVAIVTSYACHPQSYYRLGIPSPDFPGIARFLRGQSLPQTLHVHFNGAGGNITAGKYNDGSPPNRMELASRLAEGMRLALEGTERHPLTADDIGWGVVPVALPPAAHLNEADLRAQLKSIPPKGYVAAADQLAWLDRCTSGESINITCLRVGSARMLHLPGELFVEFQLAAQQMRPDLNVMMAAYGDYGPAYIGTTVSYSEGGYETLPTATNVGPDAEPILMDAMRTLLNEP